MSGIYIPGMEMPTSCFECRFSIDGFCYASGHVNIRANDERQITNWCPLVPVPEHGRLIDADALMERFSYSPGDTAEDRIWIRAARRIIIEAPTIIPADPASKEEEG